VVQSLKVGAVALLVVRAGDHLQRWVVVTERCSVGEIWEQKCLGESDVAQVDMEHRDEKILPHYGRDTLNPSRGDEEDLGDAVRQMKEFRMDEAQDGEEDVVRDAAEHLNVAQE